MTERIKIICSHIPKVKSFADVGCDHGYCTQYALKNNLCEKAYISDISEGSLSKAKQLLSREVAEGRCIPVCADGMKGLPPDCECVLIAGLGGEEMVKILKEGYLPKKFLLQPMKNAERVREELLARGAEITRDYTFFAEGVYYELIAGNREGASPYTQKEIKFGRDNLREYSSAFVGKLNLEKEKLLGYLSREGMSEESKAGVLSRLREIEEVLHDAQTNISTR